MNSEEIEFEAVLRRIEDRLLNDDVVPEDETNPLAPQAPPTTFSNMWPSDGCWEYQISLNHAPSNQIPCPSTMDHQNQIPQYFQEHPIKLGNQNPHSTTQIHIPPPTNQPNLSNVPMLHHQEEYFYHHPNHEHHTIPLGSSMTQNHMNIPNYQSLPTCDHFNSQNSYDFPVHQPPSMDEFNPQIHSGVPQQIMTLPTINQFNPQNVTQSFSDMPVGLIHHQPCNMPPPVTMSPMFPSRHLSHQTLSTPQNLIVPSVPQIYQWDPQNVSNGVQYNPRPPPHDELPPLASPEFSSDPWLPNRQHLMNQPSFNLDQQVPIDNIQIGINHGQWTEEEHRRFLFGLRMHGRGKWRKVSQVVKTRTSTQVASHAQKYFNHQISRGKKKGRKRSIHDIIDDPYYVPQPQQHSNDIVAPQNQFVASSLPMHQPYYNPQNPPRQY